MTSRQFATALAVTVLAASAHAALKPGDAAPEFRTTAALAGHAFEFDLAQALKQGPVVLYFFPKAFTQGCTIEAHAFAEASPKFAALGARVIGISRDDVDTIKRFSQEACRDQFAVGSDPGGKTVKAYDAASVIPGYASRISYVIAQDGTVRFAHQGSDPLQHVEKTLEAVHRLVGAHR
ncbi:MAG: peroxiredoxin [Burkholderiaceae bacterium]